jgi:hypothetical protein
MDDDHVEKVLAVICQNHLTVCEVAEEVKLCKSSCHLILTYKLKMHRVAAKFLLRLLTGAQKENCVTVSQELLIIPMPPYFPDLAPVDFFLFPKLKSSLKGSLFQTVEEIEKNSPWDLRAIPQNTF